MMIEALLTLLPSVIWIFYRLILIFKTQPEKLLRHLQIGIPDSPKICIDAIYASSVVIHWDVEHRPSENIIFILYIDGNEGMSNNYWTQVEKDNTNILSRSFGH